jgi:YD repeat-containing protein
MFFAQEPVLEAFGYYSSDSAYYNSTVYNISTPFQQSNADTGIRLADLNNDGFVDIIQSKESGPDRKVWINNKTGWNQTDLFSIPVIGNNVFFVDSSGNDKGLRIADLNNDGFPDFIQGWGGVRHAWLNNGSGFGSDNIFWYLPTTDNCFIDSSGVDQGVQLVDFNGDGKVDILQAKRSGSVRKAYLNTGKGWKDVSSLWVSPVYFSRDDASGSDYGTRLTDVNGDGLVDILQAFNFDAESSKVAYLNNGSGWVLSAEYTPPDYFTTSPRPDNGIRLIDLNGDGLVDLLQDYANATTTAKDAWINNGHGWTESTSWESPEPFTLVGKNIGRRIGDVNGDGFGDILIGYDTTKYVVIRNSTLPYLLKNITNEFGGLTSINYEKSTKYNNSGEDGLSDIGFNVWVVNNITQNNGLNNDFNILSNTSYVYFGGLYAYNDSEFRGFNIVNETLSDKSIISHYFHQNKELKGKEYQTITYNSNRNIYSKTENNYNFTLNNNSGYIAQLKSSSNYLYDGVNNNPIITNYSYQYDNYNNIIEKISYGNINISRDEKYEYYEFNYNVSSWILDKVKKYQLHDSSNNKLKEIKYFYDNKELGSVSRGDLTKTEEWLDTGSGNPASRFSYDDYGNLIEQIDPLGRVTKYEYGLQDTTFTYPERTINALGHKTDFNYDVATGNLLSATKNGIITYSQYDIFGRISKEILPYDTDTLPTKYYTYYFDGAVPEYIKTSQKTTSNNTLDVYYYYDGFGNVVQIKSPGDNGQQVIKNIFYDGLFRVSSEQNPYFSSSNLSLSTPSTTEPKTYYQYDTLSRITQVTNPDNTIKLTQYNKTTINDYDENNNYHTYVLDAYNRIIEVQEHNTDFYINDNETYTTTYSYNGRDELIKITDHYGNQFSFAYDSLGRKTQLNDPDLGIWRYKYDLAGNLIKQTDNIGNQIKISYDSLNRILQKNASNERIS